MKEEDKTGKHTLASSRDGCTQEEKRADGGKYVRLSREVCRFEASADIYG